MIVSKPLVFIYRAIAAIVRIFPVKFVTPIQNFVARLVLNFSKERKFLVRRHLNRTYEKNLPAKDSEEKVKKTLKKVTKNTLKLMKKKELFSKKN